MHNSLILALMVVRSSYSNYTIKLINLARKKVFSGSLLSSFAATTNTQDECSSLINVKELNRFDPHQVCTSVAGSVEREHSARMNLPLICLARLAFNGEN